MEIRGIDSEEQQSSAREFCWSRRPFRFATLAGFIFTGLAIIAFFRTDEFVPDVLAFIGVRRPSGRPPRAGKQVLVNPVRAAGVGAPALERPSLRIEDVQAVSDQRLAHELPDPDLAFPGAFERWYSESLGTAVDAHLHVEGRLPSWLDGVMFNAGPSQQGMGKYRFRHIFDGFGRINKFVFNGSGNGITFSSKMMDTKWYNSSLKEGRVAPGILIAETEPPRQFSKIPLLNALGANDNAYIMPWKIGENYLYLTDGELRLRFDPDTLQILEVINMNSYTDDAIPAGYIPAVGSAHMVPDPRAGLVDGIPDGSSIGIVGCQPILPGTGPDSIVVYRISAEDIKTRQKIAKIEVPMYSYMHSFSITKNFVILPAEPYYIATEKLVLGGSVLDAFWYNASHQTNFYAVEIDTGKVHKLTTPGFLFIHTLNAYESDAQTIVLDISGISDERGFLHEGTFLHEELFNKRVRDDDRTGPVGAVRRYTLHLDTGHVDVTEPIKLSGDGTAIVPRFNENMRGQETHFVYAPAVRYNSSSFASMAVLKMNLRSGREDAQFYEHGHFHSEMIFVPRPGSMAEDDGVLMGIVYDGPSQQSYVNVLDAKTMQQVAKAYLPFMLPFLIHSNFFPRSGSAANAAPLI